jgi:hypothetical protein
MPTLSRVFKYELKVQKITVLVGNDAVNARPATLIVQRVCLRVASRAELPPGDMAKSAVDSGSVIRHPDFEQSVHNRTFTGR